MSQVIDNLERAQLRQVPAFQAGDRVRVHFQVIKGTRRRTQVFEGTVIKRQGQGVRETFTVRKQSFGVGVERTFPVHSPKIERLEVASRGDVRRAKLYYLRGRVGRRARVRERQYAGGAGPPAADIEGQQVDAPIEGAASPAEPPPEEATAPEPAEEVAGDETPPGVEVAGDEVLADAESSAGDEADSAGEPAAPSADDEESGEPARRGDEEAGS